MKILHIANTNHFSGGENVICQIIAMFGDSNVEMAYVSPDGQIREALKERNIRFLPIKNMSRKELKIVFEKEKPDVVHAHDMKASMTTALACGKTRLVLHLHNNEYANRKISKKSVGFLLPAYKANHIFYVSKSAYEGYRFHKWFKEKSSVLSNILDIDNLKEKAHKDQKRYDYDVIFLGRFSEPKNPIRLLNVIKKAVVTNPTLKVAVVGTGELEKEVEGKWKELNLQNNVDLLGFQSNPLKILKDAKMMLMTSRWE
jgi:glycosyltransferase involved in cell wall biosynthesis